jgi:hypothetical protein
VNSCVGADTPPAGLPPPAGGIHRQSITQSSNGPNTFEEAGNYVGLTHEECQRLVFPLELSPSRTLMPTGLISQAHYATSHSYPQQIGGNGAHSVTTSNNNTTPTSLRQCDSRSLPTTSDAPPQLSTRPDLNHVSLWEAMVNQVTTWQPGHAEPPNNTGESPLLAFAARWNGTYYCFVPVGGEFCGYHNEKKIRMVSHIRDKHLDQRPWRCDGQCANPLW